VIPKTENFYNIMDQFYGSNMDKHSSPTKRLIDQKHSTTKHKKIVEKSGQRTQDYALHYTSSPGKSYVIEPKGGEINYRMARQNPLRFYE
jgi:hypothetical protein